MEALVNQVEDLQSSLEKTNLEVVKLQRAKRGGEWSPLHEKFQGLKMCLGPKNSRDHTMQKRLTTSFGTWNATSMPSY